MRAKISKNTEERERTLHRYRIREFRSMIDGQELERQRLSRELHDGIGQSLIAIKLKLDNLLYLHEHEIKDQLPGIKKQVDRIVDEIRRINNNLMPVVLDEFGLVIAIRNLCVETEESTGIRVKFEFRGEPERMGKELQLYLYRIIQEATHNIIKHAAATEAGILMVCGHDNVVLTIRDNGRGFDLKEAGSESKHGMTNMKERVRLLLGTIDIDSAPGRGTEIRLKIPVF